MKDLNTWKPRNSNTCQKDLPNSCQTGYWRK